ncbi:MAG: hypothetical protein K2W82_12770 [Candidatus Obscuribacterales bacterium]|nr:hypothetical protein [Candidatus Obscuribacterales bacterium]
MPGRNFWTFALVFGVALLVRVWYNFWQPHLNNFAACDAYEYIDNAQRLLSLRSLPSSFWQDCFSCLAGSASSQTVLSVQQALLPLKDFQISGPIFPVYLAFTLVITGGASLPLWAQWPHLLAVQTVISAATALLIGLIAYDLYDRKTGLVSGLLAAVYPGFIVNSGRLYTESFACFLLVLLSYLTCRGFKRQGNSLAVVFASGWLAAALQLTRSIMVVFTLALLVLNIIQQTSWKRRILVALLFLAGSIFVVAPWIAFQKLAFDKTGVIVDRVGHYNFFIGNNTDIGGWLSYPYPDGSGIDEKSFPQLLSEAVSKKPERWFKLMLDKPARLFKFPWNDFKTPVGPLTHEWQVLFQELLLVFCGIGLCFLPLAQAAGEPDRKKLSARLFLAILLGFHCIYFLFITVPRYNLTAMPEIVVFAAAGICSLTYLLHKKAARKTGLLLAGVLVVFVLLSLNNWLPLLLALLPKVSPQHILFGLGLLKFFVVLALGIALARSVAQFYGGRRIAKGAVLIAVIVLLPLVCLANRADGRWYEWSSDLNNAKDPLKLSLRLPASEQSRIAGRRLFLLVDTGSVNQNPDTLKVSVNGVALSGPAIPSMSLVESFERLVDNGPSTVQREGERMWDSLTGSAGISNVDLRQWTLYEIPESAIAAALGENKALANNAVANNNTDLQFAVELSSHTAAGVELFGTYDLRAKDLFVPSVSTYSWEKTFYGVENNAGFTDTRYDLKLPANNVVAQEQDLSPASGLQNGYWNVRLLLAPPAVALKNSLSVSVLPSTSTLSDKVVSLAYGSPQVSAGHSFDLTKEFLPLTPIAADALCFVTVKGKVRRISGDCGVEVSLLGRYAGAAGKQYLSAWSPKQIKAEAEWTNFEFVVPMKPILAGSGLNGIRLQLQAANPLFGFRNTLQKVKGAVAFSDLKVEVVQQPANPLGLGHLVY